MVDGVGFVISKDLTAGPGTRLDHSRAFVEQRFLELWVFLPCPEDPSRAPKMIAYGEPCQVFDLQRRFSFGTRDQVWSLKSFRVAEFGLKYEKGQGKLLT